MKPTLLILASLALLTACQPKIPADDYFPLHKGVTWHYQVDEDLTDKRSSRYFSIENLGTVSLSRKYENQTVSVRRTSDGTHYFILDAEDGRFRVAKQTVVELKPHFDQKERKILPHQSDLTIGSSWASEGRTYTLHSTPSYAVPDPDDIRFNMEYEITSVTDRVQVPAGEFKNCVRVEGRATFSLYVDPRLGYRDIHITQTEWYAPGVGLVKLLREEPLNLEIFKGGSIRFELVEFEL